MFKIQTLNAIDPEGLSLLSLGNYEIASELPNPDAIVLRSYRMHDMELPPSLKAVARAGAGVNNIPIEKCTEKGVVVFNTPGANANGVKEMVIAGLMLASRDIIDGAIWAKSLIGKGNKIPALIEKGKKNFVGQEINGKTLAVIGLGAVGVLVANAAKSLGMNVIGYDPYISVEQALKLSNRVNWVKGIEVLLTQADYVTLNIPLTPETKGYINKDKLKMMKNNVRILNFARGELVDINDLKAAIASGKVAKYITDFPDEEMLKIDNVIAVPHLGASTKESEINCAVMAINQLKDFLENGNITNSVNFPTAIMERHEGCRILIANKNIPNMVSQISSILAIENINIDSMLNRKYNGIAYNIIDITQKTINKSVIKKLNEIDGVSMVRIIQAK
ncbi:MAG: 3-phosphoglycerate dehydrogenase family protein [Dysgonamonadaceae bacterium]|jgi:D-3-phosphoglycerate dehydrogenase|nr:3-phosphoglycerate dehydrogenase family protein [Dysgonamonadaceae bacterium]MDD3357264.1 3-phosphoglycerate dehydrogenase family protein [Dysgonamonadaceae bacterium]MDD3727059.1 3-phosphoglycerate dehydrogenase family protein [Dysgonamonadaceae bacterium]MDD4605825.1 3-phosphoglycerate dehydrogenase family protein [Dysgonamonadaceae bacterium]HUI33832.1 3-phosphoglycerate dehydrogenase family protein [Dysgonamonadaceae bacterium]